MMNMVEVAISNNNNKEEEEEGEMEEVDGKNFDLVLYDNSTH